MVSEPLAVSRSQNRLCQRAVSRGPHDSKGVTLNAASRRIATAFMPWHRAPKPTSEAACRRQWPSFVPAKTLLGQLLGQISDVLSATYPICPRISQKKNIKPPSEPDRSQISDLKFEIRDTNPSIFSFPNKIVNAKNAKAPQNSQRKKATCFTGLPLSSAVGLARPMSVHRPFWRRLAADMPLSRAPGLFCPR